MKPDKVECVKYFNEWHVVDRQQIKFCLPNFTIRILCGLIVPNCSEIKDTYPTCKICKEKIYYIKHPKLDKIIPKTKNDKIKLDLAKDILQELVNGIDNWNDSMENIIGRQVNYKWPALDKAKEFLKGLNNETT